MDKITLTINDTNVGCTPGTSILDAAADHGIRIPTLCHHPDLKPYGACRMCLVEDEASGRLMAACVTPAAENMKIRSDSERVVRHRRNIARLMIAEHPESCIVCSQGNRCKLRLTAAQLGIGETRLYPMPNFKPFEQANPFIIRDLSKCILCGKCIRADHELVAVGAIDYNLRGFRSRPATVHEQPLEKSNCTFCGTCVGVCPTGALSINDPDFVGTPEKTFRSICSYCAVGCMLELGVFGRKVVRVGPANDADSVNRSTLCVRGHFAHDYLNSPNRLVSPMRRDAEDPSEPKLTGIDWETAIETAAVRLKDIATTNGPQSIAFIGSAKCTLEENYLLQKIARTAIGTNNLDFGSYAGGHAYQPLLDRRTGGRWRTFPLSEIELAEVICLFGADPSHTLPVVSYHIKRAVRAGVPLIVIDPRRTELARIATYWLAISPGDDLALINALAAVQVSKGTYDAASIDRHTEGFSVYRMGLSGIDQQLTAQSAGVDPETLVEVAKLLDGKKITWIAGSGLSRQTNRTHSIDALINLALMTGGLGRKGNRIFLLGKESNTLGAADMGVSPDLLPGRMPLQMPESRKYWEEAWQGKLSPDPGLRLPRMLHEAEKGHLKALFIMGENPLRAFPQRERVRSALNKLEFIVVQDILKGETVELADVVLPGAAPAEKKGAFTNLEGRIQTFSAAAPPPGRAKPDWEILNLVYAALGAGKPYENIEQVRAEIADLIPMYSDLNSGHAGWIKDAPGGPDQDRMAFTSVTNNQRTARPETPHDFTAIFGIRRFHLGSGTRTAHSRRVRKHCPDGTVELCNEDANRLKLVEGESVEVHSEHGSIVCRLLLSRELRPGLAFIPLAAAGNEAVDLIAFQIGKEPPESGRLTCPVGIKKLS